MQPGGSTLQNFSSARRRFWAQAERVRPRTDAATDPVLRQGLRVLEQSWLSLVQSQQSSERLGLLPSHQRSTQSSRPYLTDGNGKERSKPLISVVDDEEIVRRAMSNLIRALGYEAAIFANAEEFLTSTALPVTSVLISDVQLPGMSGPELQEALRAAGHRFPIIFMTGFPNEHARRRTLKAGALGFLGKPFKEVDLIMLLERALAPPVSGR